LIQRNVMRPAAPADAGQSLKSPDVSNRAKRVTLGVAVVVFLIALARALLFWRGSPNQPYVDLSWDPASHVLIGLDFFDSLRRLDVIAFLKRAFNEHWWPPLFGLMTLPLHVVFGRSDVPARIISLISYAALPACCSVAVLTYAARSTLAATIGIALTLVIFLTSPQLVEMSHWPMLESCAAAFGLASMLAFTTTDRPAWHRVSFVLAGLSTLLKYHYGFFLLITLTIGVLLRLPPAYRGSLRDTALAVLWKPLVILALAIAAVLLLLPPDVPTRYRWVPKAEGVPWVVYMVALLTIVAVPAVRTQARALWNITPVMARDFIGYGLSIPGIWCLDPANARVWHRQIHLTTDPPAGFSDQVHRLVDFVAFDYVASPFVVLPIVFGGIIMLLARRREPATLPLALHGIWPLVLMTGSGYIAEARFIASLVPVMFAAGILGWVALLAAMRPARSAGISAALAAMLVLTVAAAVSRAGELTHRKAYRYRFSPEEGEFIERATDAIARNAPVLVILPNDSEVPPTLRLFLRLRMPTVAPDDVFVMKGEPSELTGREHRVRAGVIAFEKGWDHPPDLVTVAEVPLPTGGGRTLLVTERRP
jgi:hypothetical protein